MHRRDRHRDVHRQRLAPDLGDGVAELARERDVRAAHAARVGQLEDPLGARVERPVDRMAEARQPPPAAWIAAPCRRDRAALAGGARLRARAAARTPRRCRGSPGRSRGCPPPRRPAATPGSAASVIRAATLVGIIPCSAIATSSRSRKNRWSSVGSSPGEQQVEVLGEAEPAHQVAAEVAAAHLDPVRVGLRDAGDGPSRLADLHARQTNGDAPSGRRRRSRSPRSPSSSPPRRPRPPSFGCPSRFRTGRSTCRSSCTTGSPRSARACPR